MKQRRNLFFSEDGRTSQLGLKAVQSAPENTIRARRGHPARTCMGTYAPSRENHRAVGTVEALRGAGPSRANAGAESGGHRHRPDQVENAVSAQRFTNSLSEKKPKPEPVTTGNGRPRPSKHGTIRIPHICCSRWRLTDCVTPNR